MHPQYTPEEIDKFWSRVDRSGGPDACWPWTGGRYSTGYGRMSMGRKKTGAHRLAWAIANGPIPDGLVICHTCDNPPCCNPAHLWAGTNQDNTADRVAKGRSAHGEKAWAKNPVRGDDHWTRREPERACRGALNGKALITEDDVRAIRARHAAGERLQAIADDYRLTKQAIWLIVKRKNWAHVS